jgi:hypothetical protein
MPAAYLAGDYQAHLAGLNGFRGLFQEMEARTRIFQTIVAGAGHGRSQFSFCSTSPALGFVTLNLQLCDHGQGLLK